MVTPRREVSQKVIRDSTETLITMPPTQSVATGTPTARIGTPAVSMPAIGSGSTATVDPLSTTTTADAAEGATTITVASAAWVRGRSYLITSALGDIIPVRSAKTITGTTLTLTEPLSMSVASGATVKGWQITIALTAAQTASIGTGCVIEWTATLDGVSEVWADRFDIVVRDGGYTLTGEALTSSSPLAARLRPDSDSDYTELIDAAWRRYLLPALLAKGIRSELFVSRTELESAHIAACEHFLAQQFENDAQVREERRREYSQALDLVLMSDTLWIDDEVQQLSVPDPAAPRRWSTTMVTR